MLQILKRIPPLNRDSKALSAGDHVERVLIENVLVRRLFPTELLAVKVIKGLDDGQSRDNRPQCQSVEHVYLDSAAGRARMFLEGRQKICGTEPDTGQTYSFESARENTRLYVRRADQLERARCPP